MSPARLGLTRETRSILASPETGRRVTSSGSLASVVLTQSSLFTSGFKLNFQIFHLITEQFQCDPSERERSTDIIGGSDRGKELQTRSFHLFYGLSISVHKINQQKIWRLNFKIHFQNFVINKQQIHFYFFDNSRKDNKLKINIHLIFISFQCKKT